MWCFFQQLLICLRAYFTLQRNGGPPVQQLKSLPTISSLRLEKAKTKKRKEDSDSWFPSVLKQHFNVRKLFEILCQCFIFVILRIENPELHPLSCPRTFMSKICPVKMEKKSFSRVLGKVHGQDGLVLLRMLQCSQNLIFASERRVSSCALGRSCVWPRSVGACERVCCLHGVAFKLRKTLV